MVERELFGIEQRPEQVAGPFPPIGPRQSRIDCRPLRWLWQPAHRGKEQPLDERIGWTGRRGREKSCQGADVAADLPENRVAVLEMVTSPERSQAQAVTRSERPNVLRK